MQLAKTAGPQIYRRSMFRDSLFFPRGARYNECRLETIAPRSPDSPSKKGRLSGCGSIDGRPLSSRPVRRKTFALTVPAASRRGAADLRLEGFRKGELAAATRVALR